MKKEREGMSHYARSGGDHVDQRVESCRALGGSEPLESIDENVEFLDLEDVRRNQRVP